MTASRLPPRAEALLFERERRGVLTLSLVRAGFVVLVAGTVWVIGVNLFEKLVTTGLALLVLAVIAGSLFLLGQRRAVSAVGLAGVLVDVGVLATLPVVWYLSVGGAEVAPAYMLKTQATVLTLGVVALNALAMRPLYPLLVALGGVAVHGGLLLFALADPRTQVSSDFVVSALGPALSVEFVAIAMLIVAASGLALAYLTHLARQTVIQAVGLEVANARLGRYFSPGVVARIVGGGEDISQIGGRAQEVAVLFSDIRDFTALTESLPPPDVVAFLSRYHAAMLDAVFTFEGTIDKFIGDGIMVTFGTPEPAAADAERAVRAALAMNRALATLNAERAGAGQASIRHGIGIHHGTVVAGNIGTEARLEYTVVGDVVNTANRIQDACKEMGESLLISDAVAARLPSGFALRPVGAQRVKGRDAAVNLLAVDADEPL